MGIRVDSSYKKVNKQIIFCIMNFKYNIYFQLFPLFSINKRVINTVYNFVSMLHISDKQLK